MHIKCLHTDLLIYQLLTYLSATHTHTHKTIQTNAYTTHTNTYTQTYTQTHTTQTNTNKRNVDKDLHQQLCSIKATSAYKSHLTEQQVLGMFYEQFR